ncbi:hypothetical protein J6TS1_40930 [Siminovitchia terrae]|uniref:Cbb3-type cytochrome oxidase assembly protein CcoS n=1 Tax=Siminovitchia terrae TaxID=1914933 RepID=A0ABQ4L1Q6_SIMTE|nr:hypothetical protein [Siminovitchia terrae]GIN92150.1 hypothetical protein J22TS1_32010 [Siminovitchia terrae]GIN98223.1 hypothetical protein J6TS1_40930 [Siminovitchia terrae]
MDVSILIGLVIFLMVVALFLVFFISSALNFEDANRVDQPLAPKKLENRNEH